MHCVFLRAPSYTVMTLLSINKSTLNHIKGQDEEGKNKDDYGYKVYTI